MDPYGVPGEILGSPDDSGEIRRGNWEQPVSNRVQTLYAVQGNGVPACHDSRHIRQHGSLKIPAYADRNRESPGQGTGHVPTLGSGQGGLLPVTGKPA